MRAAAEISGLVVNGRKEFMVRCNKDVAMHKKSFILPSYMNETAFCQSR